MRRDTTLVSRQGNACGHPASARARGSARPALGDNDSVRPRHGSCARNCACRVCVMHTHCVHDLALCVGSLFTETVH